MKFKAGANPKEKIHAILGSFSIACGGRFR